MKFCRVSIFLALLVAVCLPAVAQAQIQFNVPFNFSAAGKSLPAGQYRVSEVYRTAWLVSGYKVGVVMLTNSVESPGKAHRPSLIFWHSGNTYSLVQIWPTEFRGQQLLLKPQVKATVLAQSGKPEESGSYVEIAGQ